MMLTVKAIAKIRTRLAARFKKAKRLSRALRKAQKVRPEFLRKAITI